MAIVNQQITAFSQSSIDFNLAVETNLNRTFSNDLNLTRAYGAVMEDVYNFQPRLGGSNLQIMGTGMSATIDISTGNAGPLTGGTAQELIYSENASTNIFQIYDFSIDATLIYNAAYTSSTADDLAVLALILGGNDTFFLSSKDDDASGLDGDDSMLGYAGNDYLSGDAGYDTLDGGTGNDTLAGGLDDDIYYTDGLDTILEEADEGIDHVFSTATLTLGDNLDDLTLTGSLAINATGNELDNILTGNGAANFLNGGTGADTLVGGAGNDSYYTDGGDTLIESATPGIDIVGSTVSFTLGANFENLFLLESSAVNGTGNGLNNAIAGNAAANTLNGSGGNDTLLGDGGADKLIGGSGSDILLGGTGKDTLTGNTGADSFYFSFANESSGNPLSADTITDFIRGTDRIDLRDIDAFSPTALNNNFLWRGTAGFSSSTAGEVRYQKFDYNGTANDYTIVFIDTDADRDAEMSIRLIGLHNLAASDFFL